ncbi:MAG: hypothetical protein IH939_07580 [Acidobacteria bacterium]|nr:hypothetical protein [Acidobacteriota bacterium]
MRRRFVLALGVLVLAGLQAPSAQEGYSRHGLVGCPDGASDSNELVIRAIYVLSNTPEAKGADWVAFRITTETIGPSQTYTWRTDPWLPATSRLEPDDYTGGGRIVATHSAMTWGREQEKTP